MTEQMTALRFYGARDMRAETVDRPSQLGEHDVRVAIGAAGICGSDLHVFQTGAYVTQIPVVMGHEFSGTVLEVGSEVAHLAPGDHVVGDSRVFCGACEYCRRGEGNLCVDIGFLGEVRDGAFAEEMAFRASSLVKINPGVPFHLSALAEPLAVACHALSLAPLDECSRALVIGAGPIGALIHGLLKIKGFSASYITDVSEYRRRAVAEKYPAAVVDPQGPYDLVFETTGAAAVMENLVPKVLGKQGFMVMVGLFEDRPHFDFTQLVELEWRVSGCAAFSTELPEAVKILEEHGPEFEHVVSHRLPLTEGRRAFDILLDPAKEAVKIMFVPSEDQS